MDERTTLHGKTYLVRSFGCQMNLHDAERVSGLLDSYGCLEVATVDEADIVVYMTCCVREGANTRLYGNVTETVSAAAPPSGQRIVCVGGCIAQQAGEMLRENIPSVNVIFGTRAIASVPTLVANAFSNPRTMQIDVNESEGFSSDLPAHRELSYHAWVPIMTGCNNFCSYCIVPYVRGRERSRQFEDVVDECARLVDDGVREICLLGQNVNSYGRDLYGDPRFAELLREVGATGIERIRFTSSHPKDLSDQTIAAMAETPAVMPQLPLAVQSGSDRILKAMNRHYTRESYTQLTRRLRDAIPGIALGTDLIVGFPGETEEDFQQTLGLVEEVGFDSAFTFIYSRRPGTPAAKIVDDTPREVIQERFDRLVALVAKLSERSNLTDLGSDVEVLIEGSSKRDEGVLVGHSQRNQTVHMACLDCYEPGDLVGKLIDVHVDEAKTWYLKGVATGDPR